MALRDLLNLRTVLNRFLTNSEIDGNFTTIADEVDRKVAINGSTPFTGGQEHRGLFIREATSLTRIDRPAGGSYFSSVSTITGAIKIDFPAEFAFTRRGMFFLELDFYMYSVPAQAFKCYLSGFADTTVWDRCNAVFVGPDNTQYTVRFGQENGRRCIWIGELDTIWRVVQLNIASIQAGYSTATQTDFTKGWELSVVTAFGTVEKTASNNLAFAKTDVANVAGIADYALATDLRSYIDRGTVSTSTTNVFTLPSGKYGVTDAGASSNPSLPTVNGGILEVMYRAGSVGTSSEARVLRFTCYHPVGLGTYIANKTGFSEALVTWRKDASLSDTELSQTQFKGSLTSGSNVNDLLDLGDWRVVSTASATTMTGLPEATPGFLAIRSWGTSNTAVTQTYTTIAGNMYSRGRVNAAWSDWVKSASSVEVAAVQTDLNTYKGAVAGVMTTVINDIAANAAAVPDQAVAAVQAQRVSPTGSLPGSSALDNPLMNSNFQLWERGLTQNTAGCKSADRWCLNIASPSTCTASRVMPSANLSARVRLVIVGGSGTGGAINYTQAIENVHSYNGQRVSISGLMALISGAGVTALEIIQNFGAGGSAEVRTFVAKKSFTGTNRVLFENTLIPSTSGKTVGDGNHLALVFWFSAGSTYNSRTGSIGNQTQTVELTDVKLETGPVATPYAIKPITQEIKDCERFYQRAKVFQRVDYILGPADTWLSTGTQAIMRTRPRRVPTVTVIQGSILWARNIATAEIDDFIVALVWEWGNLSNATIRSVQLEILMDADFY